MRIFSLVVLLVVVFGSPRQTTAQDSELGATARPIALVASSPAPANLDEIIDRIIAREHYESQLMTYFHPVLQTHIWEFREKHSPDYPWRTWEYVGRASATADRLSVKSIHSPYYVFYNQGGFWQMAFVDRLNFDRQHYNFSYIGIENDDLVFDLNAVVPEESGGHFKGRIWVEREDYTIVRFNGTFTTQHKWEALPFPHRETQEFPTFDSFRTNVQGDFWLPSAVKSEEDGIQDVQLRWKMRTQTDFSDYPVTQLSTMRLPQYSQQKYQKFVLPPVHLGKKFWIPWIVDAGLIVASTELDENCMHSNKCEAQSIIGSHPSRLSLYSVRFGMDGLAFILARKDRLHRRNFYADMETDAPLIFHGLDTLSQIIRVSTN